MIPKMPNFRIVHRTTKFILIEDIGPWDEYPTITNNPEDTVYLMYEKHGLDEDQQLFYIDSDGQLDELTHMEGKFLNFRIISEGGVFIND